MTTPLLEGYRRCRGSDPDRMEAYLDTVGFRVEALHDDDAPLDMRVKGVYLPGMYIGYTQYGKAATIRAAPERTDYWFLLPVHGTLEARVRKDLVDCDPRRGVLSDPSRTGQLVRSETGCGRLNIILTETAIQRQLGALLGMPLSRPPDFESAIDVAEGYGRNFAGYLRLAIEDFERGGAMLSSPIAMQQFEQMVFTNLLLSHPHSYTQSLRRLARSLASGDVKRAVDYMEANLTSPIGLPDITAAAGVPGRTLLEHFRRYKGTSPMGYLRHARFARAREALGSAEPEENITRIAMGLGFSHMGRFSVEYRRRYGESPSETLRRRRNLPSGASGPSWSGRIRGFRQTISHRVRLLLLPRLDHRRAR